VLKKIIACILVSIFIFFTGYFVSNYQSTKQHSADLAVYESRLGDITKLNTELKNENSRITDLNIGLTNRLATITKRLDSAKTIVDGLDGQAQSDGDAIQRLIENVSRLEQAISIIFENKQN